MLKTLQKAPSDQSADEIHSALKAALKSMAEAEKCAVICFGEIMDRRLYRDLGYSSINQYAEMALGFSARRTGDFVMLCKRLKKLPLIKEQVETGKIGYTAARVIAPIVDQTNEKQWVDFAATHSRRELEREVKQAKQEAAAKAKGQPSLLPVPARRPAAVVAVRVNLEMTPTQFSRYEKLWEQIRKQGEAPEDKVDALLEIMQSFMTKIGPRGQNSVSAPPVQIHIHKCEDCAKASTQTSRGELEISAEELEQAECDCQLSRPGERNKTSIPPATRRAVLAKSRHKCQRPGCDHTQYLHLHHKISRTEGGSNDPDNLIVLCSACHQLEHRRSVGISGFLAKSPKTVYRWGSGAKPKDTCPPAGYTRPTGLPSRCCTGYVFSSTRNPAFRQG